MKRKSDLAEALSKVRGKKIGVKCRSCGQIWYPNPKKWNNLNFIKKNGINVKALHCPSCNATNYLRLADVGRIMADSVRRERLRSGYYGKTNHIHTRRTLRRA